MAKKRRPAFKPTATPRRRTKVDPRPLRKKAPRKRMTLREMIRRKFNAETIYNHLKHMSRETHTHKIESERPDLPPIFPYYRLIPTDNDMDCYEKSDNYSLPSRIGGEDFGRVIKQYLKITEGMQEDSQMKEAKRLYKSQTYPAFNSEATDHMIEPSNSISRYLTLLYSQVGINRQGVWMPLRQTVADLSEIWSQPTALRKYQHVSPMLGRLSMWYEIRERLLSNVIKNWLTDSNQFAADIFFAIPSIQDVITISNVMKYSPVDLKIYVCRCKSKTPFAPNACWFNPLGGSGNLKSQLMNANYRYNPTTAEIQWPTADDDPPEAAYTARVESSVNIAATPKMSPMFRTHWEIMDVLNQVIEPTDKYELTVDREFRRAFSGRDLEQGYQSYISDSERKNENGYWQEGDVTLLVTFRGLPGIVKNESAGETTKLREVDHTPAKIMMQSRSSFEICSNDILNSEEKSGGFIDTLSAYVSSVARILDTSIVTSDFKDNTWEIDITTNVENKTGGSR